MDFGLSEEQNMVVETVRSFVENELYPLEAELERSGELPRDMIEVDVRQKDIRYSSRTRGSASV